VTTGPRAARGPIRRGRQRLRPDRSAPTCSSCPIYWHMPCSSIVHTRVSSELRRSLGRPISADGTRDSGAAPRRPRTRLDGVRRPGAWAHEDERGRVWRWKRRSWWPAPEATPSSFPHASAACTVPLRFTWWAPDPPAGRGSSAAVVAGRPAGVNIRQYARVVKAITLRYAFSARWRSPRRLTVSRPRKRPSSCTTVLPAPGCRARHLS